MPDQIFHYLSERNLRFISAQCKTTKTRHLSTEIRLPELTLNGRDRSSLRYCINRASRYNFTIERQFRKIEDVEELLKEWSAVLAPKYFRNYSGKNLYFFKNGWHKDCIGLFLYDDDRLVSFAVSSVIGEHSVYIIRKALCNRYYGLTEFTDMLMFWMVKSAGGKVIDMGQTKNGLLFYKSKFPGSSQYSYYDGSIK